MTMENQSPTCLRLVGRKGGTPLPGLIGMCRWMGWHFHGWSNYNGVAFSIELLECGRKFSEIRTESRTNFLGYVGIQNGNILG